MDIATITAAMTGIKLATEIASNIRQGSVELEKAELKLSLAEIIGNLADAKIAIVNIQEELHENEEEIKRLKVALRTRENVTRVGDAYYMTDNNANPYGTPYCLNCWENESKLCSLVEDSMRNDRKCPKCKTQVMMLNSKIFDVEPM